jgi:hypothetical protein
MICSSVRTGVVSASLMLQRLGAYPRHNDLARALREIGRIQRTLLVLDWLEDPQLRRQTTVELNKGEARNGLARAVSFHRLGRVRDRSAEARQHRASAHPGHRHHRALEHRLSRSRAGRAPPRRRPGHRRSARPPRPAGLAPHQSHGRRVGTLRFGKKTSCYLERLV